MLLHGHVLGSRLLARSFTRLSFYISLCEGVAALSPPVHHHLLLHGHVLRFVDLLLLVLELLVFVLAPLLSSVRLLLLILILVHHLLLLLPLELLVHILYVIRILHFCGSHGERLLVKQRNDPLLRQHQLNHPLSFMLVELVVFIESARLAGHPCVT